MIQNCKCGQRLTRVADNCLFAVWRCPTGRHGAYTQRKRRPSGADEDECTWAVFCAAHPGKRRRFQR